MFILDTDVLSATHRKRPPPSLIDWLTSLPTSDICTSEIVITEIEAGIARLIENGSPEAVPAVRWFEKSILPIVTVIPFMRPAGSLYSRMVAIQDLRTLVIFDPRSRKSLPGADLMIAATAISIGAPVATRNVRHFLRIHEYFQLPGLYDPFTGAWAIDQTGQLEFQFGTPVEGGFRRLISSHGDLDGEQLAFAA